MMWKPGSAMKAICHLFIMDVGPTVGIAMDHDDIVASIIASIIASINSIIATAKLAIFFTILLTEIWLRVSFYNFYKEMIV